MKRFLTILAVAPFVLGVCSIASATTDPEYGWTISNDPASAYSNTGPFVPGLLNLKLWYACNNKDGMAAAEFDLVSKNPLNVVLAVTAKNGYLNAGSGTKLLLAVGGCPAAQPEREPVNAADILVLANAPGQYGLAPSNVTGNKVTVDCQANPVAWPIQWLGFSDDGQEPQQKDWDKCAKAPVSVEDTSWGAVKALYR